MAVGWDSVAFVRRTDTDTMFASLRCRCSATSSRPYLRFCLLVYSMSSMVDSPPSLQPHHPLHAPTSLSLCFQYLHVGELLSASKANRTWRSAACSPLTFRGCVAITVPPLKQRRETTSAITSGCVKVRGPSCTFKKPAACAAASASAICQQLPIVTLAAVRTADASTMLWQLHGFRSIRSLTLMRPMPPSGDAATVAALGSDALRFLQHIQLPMDALWMLAHLPTTLLHVEVTGRLPAEAEEADRDATRMLVQLKPLRVYEQLRTLYLQCIRNSILLAGLSDLLADHPSIKVELVTSKADWRWLARAPAGARLPIRELHLAHFVYASTSGASETEAQDRLRQLLELCPQLVTLSQAEDKPVAAPLTQPSYGGTVGDVRIISRSPLRSQLTTLLLLRHDPPDAADLSQLRTTPTMRWLSSVAPALGCLTTLQVMACDTTEDAWAPLFQQMPRLTDVNLPRCRLVDCSTFRHLPLLQTLCITWFSASFVASLLDEVYLKACASAFPSLRRLRLVQGQLYPLYALLAICSTDAAPLISHAAHRLRVAKNNAIGLAGQLDSQESVKAAVIVAHMQTLACAIPTLTELQADSVEVSLDALRGWRLPVGSLVELSKSAPLSSAAPPPDSSATSTSAANGSTSASPFVLSTPAAMSFASQVSTDAFAFQPATTTAGTAAAGTTSALALSVAGFSPFSFGSEGTAAPTAPPSALVSNPFMFDNSSAAAVSPFSAEESSSVGWTGSTAAAGGIFTAGSGSSSRSSSVGGFSMKASSQRRSRGGGAGRH